MSKQDLKHIISVIIVLAGIIASHYGHSTQLADIESAVSQALNEQTTDVSP